MTRLLKKYYSLNILIVFVVLLSIYSIALTIEFNFIFTDDFYLNAYEGKKSLESIQSMLVKERVNQWINIPIATLVILIPSLLIGFCLSVGVIFKEVKVTYSKLFSLALKAQIIFAINYLTAVLLRSFNLIHYSINTVNNNYYFQSPLIFFNTKSLPYWLHYPIQCINIAELIHILFLSFGVSWLLQQKYSKSLIFVLIWYGIGLLFWVVFTVFLQTILNL